MVTMIICHRDILFRVNLSVCEQGVKGAVNQEGAAAGARSPRVVIIEPRLQGGGCPTSGTPRAIGYHASNQVGREKKATHT